MNKKEKIICLFLGLALVWCFFSSKNTPSGNTVENDAASVVESQTNVVAAATQEVKSDIPSQEKGKTAEVKSSAPSVPEQIVTLENSELKIEVSSWGAAVKKATLKKYALKAGDIGEDNPPVDLCYTNSPLGALECADVLPSNAAYVVKEKGEDFVVFANAAAKIERKITLKGGYKVVFDDSFAGSPLGKNTTAMSMGSMIMGSSADDILSIDSLDQSSNKVVHYGSDDETPLYALLAGGTDGGCSCSGPRKVTPADPLSYTQKISSAQKWVALKDRFFVTAFAGSTQSNEGFVTTVLRDSQTAVFRPSEASAKVVFGAGSEKRTSEFFVGPKVQSLLWDSGMKDVMDFGMWSWICYPMVWLLNFFNSLIPNYGVAIILLTILVRLVFWPLTRKSTEGMKKMQEIQPLMKELQQKFKDNPQRLQQETWALYREKKVNPMSSCLPMLIQIPIFIALFNVLRSMVELRYAGFLWIGDLSAPEHLFASVFPFGGLNILPLLMALTMYIQSKLTPSTGDKNQQRMMTVFMPLMMLFMFYNFASALSLYWTLSQVLSIIQMWMMRRESERKRKVLEPEVIDPPTTTRQMRRHA